MGARLIEQTRAGVLIAGPEDLSKRVADLLGDREYSVRTTTADQLIQDLRPQDCELVVLDLSGTPQEEGPMVD